MSVQVDQVTGVGTIAGRLRRHGRRVPGERVLVVTVNPMTTRSPWPHQRDHRQGALQGWCSARCSRRRRTPDRGHPTDGPSTVLNASRRSCPSAPQQSEVIKFAQLDGNLSLILRSSKDFQDPNDPKVQVTPLPDETTGIILRTLVDEYGVLVPQIIETILPAQATPAR
jgi:Flp pilus assembly protein CpaB